MLSLRRCSCLVVGEAEQAMLPTAAAPNISAKTGTARKGTPQHRFSSKQYVPAYTFFTASSAGLAVLALCVPDQLLQVALPDAQLSGLESPLVRMFGATMVMSCAAEFCLKDAAENERLKSATYQRLLLAVGTKSLGYLAAFAQASAIHTPLLWATYPTMATVSVVANVAVLYQALASSGDMAGSLTALLPAAPKSFEAQIYTAFAALWLLLSAASFGDAMFGGAAGLTVAGELLLHTCAPGFFLAAVTCIVLQDAADRGRLSASTFRRLNLGLSVFQATVVAVAVSGGLVDSGTSALAVAGVAGVAAYCAYQSRYLPLLAPK